MTRRIIPDVEFTGSTSNTPEIDMELQTRNFPGGALNTDASDRQRVVRTLLELTQIKCLYAPELDSLR